MKIINYKFLLILLIPLFLLSANKRDLINSNNGIVDIGSLATPNTQELPLQWIDTSPTLTVVPGAIEYDGRVDDALLSCELGGFYGDPVCPTGKQECNRGYHEKNGTSVQRIINVNFVTPIFKSTIALGKVGDNYYQGTCRVFEETGSFKIDDLSKVDYFKLIYAKYDDWLQVTLNGNVVLQGPFPSHGMNVVNGAVNYIDHNGNSQTKPCELKRSWEWFPDSFSPTGRDVKRHLITGINTFKIKTIVSGGGEGYARFKTQYEGLNGIQCITGECKPESIGSVPGPVINEYEYYDYICEEDNNSIFPWFPQDSGGNCNAPADLISYSDPISGVTKYKCNEPTPPANNCKRKYYTCPIDKNIECVENYKNSAPNTSTVSGTVVNTPSFYPALRIPPEILPDDIVCIDGICYLDSDEDDQPDKPAEIEIPINRVEYRVQKNGVWSAWVLPGHRIMTDGNQTVLDDFELRFTDASQTPIDCNGSLIFSDGNVSSASCLYSFTPDTIFELVVHHGSKVVNGKIGVQTPAGGSFALSNSVDGNMSIKFSGLITEDLEISSLTTTEYLCPNGYGAENNTSCIKMFPCPDDYLDHNFSHCKFNYNSTYISSCPKDYIKRNGTCIHEEAPVEVLETTPMLKSILVGSYKEDDYGNIKDTFCSDGNDFCQFRLTNIYTEDDNKTICFRDGVNQRGCFTIQNNCGINDCNYDQNCTFDVNISYPAGIKYMKSTDDYSKVNVYDVNYTKIGEINSNCRIDAKVGHINPLYKNSNIISATADKSRINFWDPYIRGPIGSLQILSDILPADIANGFRLRNGNIDSVEQKGFRTFTKHNGNVYAGHKNLISKSVCQGLINNTRFRIAQGEDIDEQRIISSLALHGHPANYNYNDQNYGSSPCVIKQEGGRDTNELDYAIKLTGDTKAAAYMCSPIVCKVGQCQTATCPSGSTGSLLRPQDQALITTDICTAQTCDKNQEHFAGCGKYGRCDTTVPNVFEVYEDDSKYKIGTCVKASCLNSELDPNTGICKKWGCKDSVEVNGTCIRTLY
ncbi:MAG: Unknown protein [uncultured Campylobacterales bacterium]|uniref:Uncharacterized protein n=1 Tax=uncultured Campylobacterales bacterium TaxID=352960 RepID=A0A6S6TAW5_9BACT|nr:MAG: Unknown protein [uncultured Campylobacterales bacterium]